MSNNAIVALAKRQAENIEDGKPVRLSTGYGYAIFRPVSTILVTDAQASVPDPAVPKWFNEEKGREEENPNHPDYTKGLEEAQVKRMLAVVDVLVMMGMELCDEEGTPQSLPEDSAWLTKLKFLGKRGSIKLEEYDLDDSFDKEFLFKRYIAVSNAELAILTKLSGVSEEEVAQAEASFQGNAQRNANKRGKAK